MALTRLTPSMINAVKFSFASVDDAKNDPYLTIGDFIETLGYERPGDGGDSLYEIVAAGTGTDDGGSYIDLTASNTQAKLLPDTEIKAESFGVVLDSNNEMQERSAQFNKAFAFAAELFADTFADDAGEDLEIVTRGFPFSCSTDFKAKDPLYLERSNGSQARDMEIKWNGHVVATTGGLLATHTQERPIPVVVSRVRNSTVSWPRIECEMLCAGVKVKNDIGNQHFNLELRGFSRYGLWKVANNDSTWWDPIIKQFYRDPLWVRNGVDPTDWDNWNADCVVVSTKDHRIIGGQIGWGGPAFRMLDTYPDNDDARIPGQNCYWCGLESDQDYLDGDNGAGDVVVHDTHVMQGVDADVGWSGPRYGAYADYDFATGNLVIRRVDSPIGILSFCKISNLSFFDRLDNDNCVHYLFGAQIELTDETPGSATNPPSTTDGIGQTPWFDPRIRVFANRGSAGGTRYPFMASMHHQRDMTIAFYDNPAEIYWNGSALVEASTSWDGDWDEWNRLNRASGSYSGQVQYQGFLPVGTTSPTVTAAGDYWIGQGTSVVNPGGVNVADGQIIYAKVSSPANAGDWEVADADSAPVRNPDFPGKNNTHFEVDVKSSEYILYPQESVSSIPERNVFSNDEKYVEKIYVGSSSSITKSFDGTDFSVTGADSYSFDSPVQIQSYTVATLPSASYTAGLIYVSDETGGAVLAFSDGTNWRRVTDRAVVS